MFIAGFLIPLILDATINTIPTFKGVIENVTIYGYSYSIFLIAIILCFIPINVFLNYISDPPRGSAGMKYHQEYVVSTHNLFQ